MLANIIAYIVDVDASSDQGKTSYTRALATMLGEQIFIDAYGEDADVLAQCQGLAASITAKMLGGSEKANSDGSKSLRHFQVVNIDVNFPAEAPSAEAPTPETSVNTELLEMTMKVKEIIDNLAEKPKKMTKVVILEKLKEAIS